MEPNIILNTIEEKRTFLKKLSKAVGDLVQAGVYTTINEAVIDSFYKDEVNTDFRTFPEWQREGYRIKKGSKAFIVWGKPKRSQDKDKADAQGKEAPATDDDKGDFFPIAFLFSNAQVERREAK
jgi:hypothetical protein